MEVSVSSVRLEDECPGSVECSKVMYEVPLKLVSAISTDIFRLMQGSVDQEHPLKMSSFCLFTPHYHLNDNRM